MKNTNKINIKLYIFLLITIFSFSLPLSAEKKLEVITFPGAQPSKATADNSIEIEFLPPSEHIEKPEIAKQYSVQKFYQYPMPGSELSMSYFSVTYSKKKDQDLEGFVYVNNAALREQCPKAIIGLLQIIDETNVAYQFRQQNIPYMASLTWTNKEGFPDLCAFYFETKEGFWTITWNASMEFIKKRLDIFFDFINNIKIKTKE